MPVSEIILVLMLLLAIGMLTAGIFRKLPIPYTVLLVLIGVALKSAADNWSLFAPLNHFELTPELILFIFLPTLIFESGFNLNARALIKDIAPVLMLAIPALLASTVIVGVGVWFLLPLELSTALVFGALISATDPVAVVALFKELGTPKRLTILVEGESLFNDATAIVLFNILLGIALYGGMSWGALSGAGLTFIKVFFGGVLVGVVFGLMFGWVMVWLKADAAITLTLSLVMAYSAFVVAEHSLHLSGVMAVVAGAISLGIVAVPRLSHETGETLKETWEFLALVCNTLLFILVGFSVDLPHMLSQSGVILLVVLLLLAARASTIYTLVPLSTRVFHLPKITPGERHIMWWGGLKGGLAIAIVLSIPHDLPGYQTLLDVTLGVVLFTLLVNAPSIRPLIHWLGIDRFSSDEQAELQRGLDMAQHAARNTLARFQKAGVLSRGRQLQLVQFLKDELKASEYQVTEDQRFRRQRLNTLRVEVDTLSSLYKAGMFSYYTYLDLQGEVIRARRHISADNRNRMASPRHQNPFLRLEDALIKRLRESDWASSLLSRYQNVRLSQHLLKDIARILMVRSALEYLDTEPKLQQEHRERLEQAYRKRLSFFQQNVNEIQRDFPEFYASFESRLSTRAALTAAAQEIEDESRHGTIGAKPYQRITWMIEQSLGRLPSIATRTAELDTRELIGLLPLFAGLDKKTLNAVARKATSVHFLQDDTVISEGDRGDALYIVARGVLGASRRNEKGESVVIGKLAAGDLFGEMALLGKHVRGATVQAWQSSTLLRLSRKDVLALAASHKEIELRLKASQESHKELLDALMTLKPVYTASNSMEAHLVKKMLVGQGIDAFVEGDLLQGVVSDLPAAGLMQVLVKEENESAARAAIRKWDAGPGDEDNSGMRPQL